MTNSKEFIRTKLVNRTNANDSMTEAKNNRWHYYVEFDESIGWDWIKTQIKKAKAELDVQLEVWEIHPSEDGVFEIEIREVDRREGIDNSQSGLSSFS
jgi:hypothetical protein